MISFEFWKTETVKLTEIGIVTTAVIFGPGIKEVHIYKPSAAIPIVETTAQIPSRHDIDIASAKATVVTANTPPNLN